jgi:hypothetical protein
MKKIFYEFRGNNGGIRISFLIIFSSIIYICCTGCKPGLKEDTKVIEIRGIYGNPEPLWKKDLLLKQQNVNSIFLSWHAINESMMEKAKNEGLRVFAEFPVLNGEKYVENHPEAWAIDNQGNKVKPAGWFMGVCPTEPVFRQFRMEELRTLLSKFDLDGVWMDYVHWHAQFEEPEPILPETCFCNNCISSFKAMTGISVPSGTVSEQAEWILANHDDIWRDWRCTIIADWARDMKNILKRERPDALFGLYHCPWDDTEFNGARRRILGLDYEMLAEVIDVFSPMVYHGRMGRKPEWVRENIEWFSGRLPARNDSLPRIWPIVQAYNDPYIITSGEFEKVLRYGVSGKSTGIMMFTSYAVAESEEKIETMKKVYSEFQTENK